MGRGCWLFSTTTNTKPSLMKYRSTPPFKETLGCHRGASCLGILSGRTSSVVCSYAYAAAAPARLADECGTPASCRFRTHTAHDNDHIQQTVTTYDGVHDHEPQVQRARRSFSLALERSWIDIPRGCLRSFGAFSE